MGAALLVMMVGEPGSAKTKGHTHHVFFFPFVPVYPVPDLIVREQKQKNHLIGEYLIRERGRMKK